MCADCPDQSCFTCALRLREARAYDQLAAQLLHREQTARTARIQPGLPAPPGLPADKEAGQ
jgi:hypothetical protein